VGYEKTYILIGSVIVILSGIIISSYFLYFNKQAYQYGTSKHVVGKQYTIMGVLLCDWRYNKCNPQKHVRLLNSVNGIIQIKLSKKLVDIRIVLL